MDQHLKFRFESMKQGSASRLGNQGHIRFPQSNTPKLFRPKCRPIPLGEPSQPATPQALPAAGAAPSEEEAGQQSPQVQQQVKQLQFWLRVFSRFCHDDPAQD